MIKMKPKKRGLSVLTAVLLCFSMAAVPVFADTDAVTDGGSGIGELSDDTVSIAEYFERDVRDMDSEESVAAYAAAEQEDTGMAAAAPLTGEGGTLESGRYFLEDDVTLLNDIVVEEGSTVVIDLNGYTLTGTGTSCVIANFGTLMIEDASGDDSGTITGGAGVPVEDEDGSILYYGGGVYSEGALVIDGGTIYGNSASAGGGVFCAGGTFVMNGGRIVENIGVLGAGVFALFVDFRMNGGGISDNYESEDLYEEFGGVFGGGIYLLGSLFTMNDGTVSGNIGTTGGGIYSESSELVMNGGSVSGNFAYWGGGMAVQYSEFTMNDGILSENYCVYGGGIHSCCGEFTMNGGEISGNTAANWGGGVMNEGYAPDETGALFTMNGGEISGNTAENWGGGINNYYANVFIEGGTIRDNCAGAGGGVMNNGVAGDAFVTLNGGEVYDNIAETGGGVYNSSGTFVINGGTVTGNIATEAGGGVANLVDRGMDSWDAAFIMYGGAVYGNAAGTEAADIYSSDDEYGTITMIDADRMEVPGLSFTAWFNDSADARYADTEKPVGYIGLIGAPEGYSLIAADWNSDPGAMGKIDSDTGGRTVSGDIDTAGTGDTDDAAGTDEAGGAPESVDTGGESESGSTDGSGDTTCSVRTADDNSPYLWLFLAVAAGALTTAAGVRRRTA